MIIRFRTITFFLFIVLLAGCGFFSKSFELHDCEIKVPKQYEELQEENYLKFYQSFSEELTFSVIALKKGIVDMEPPFNKENQKHILSFEKGTKKFRVYELFIEQTNTTFRIVDIDYEDVQLKLFNVNPQDYSYILGSCFDQRLIN